jgi:uncharacterized membrane protein SpoIIM required for sporulation
MSATPPGSGHGYRELRRRDAALEFRERHQALWEALEHLTDQALRCGPSHLEPNDVEALARLYRRCAATLAFAREVVLDDALVEYLETLTARAHLALQCGPRRHRVTRFIVRELPRAVWRLRSEVGLASGLLALGIVLGWIWTLLEPSWFFPLVDDALAIGRSPADKTQTLRLALQPQGSQTSLAWACLADTARSGFLAFALGFLAGIPTAFIMLGGGLSLGAIGALYFERGLGAELVAYLLPSGIPVLVAFVLCGAAGLYLGRAVLFPGSRPVSESLRRARDDSTAVMLGAIGLGAVALVSHVVCLKLELSTAWCGGLAGFNLVWIAAWMTLGVRSSPGRPR